MKKELSLTFIPNKLDARSGETNIECFTRKKDNVKVIYIVNSKLHTTFENDEQVASEQDPTRAGQQNLIIQDLNKIQENFHKNNSSEDNIFISYDYDAFCETQVPLSEPNLYGDHFCCLSTGIKKYSKSNNDVPNIFNKICKKIFFIIINVLISWLRLLLKLFDRIHAMVPFLSTVRYFRDDLKNLCWAFEDIAKHRRLTPDVGNVLAAKLLDIAVGVVILSWFRGREARVCSTLGQSMEAIIEHLQKLLEFLMGSPVGLKLNHAFNRTMGGLFLYHIMLWKTFLGMTRPVLEAGVRAALVLAVLGCRTQAALAADTLGLASFHVHCIYVFAARLYGMQVRALTSLWRLLLGRKYNPLRGRLDSYRCTHHQLFVGTLAFTVLLFLLPTTLLHYVVFTALRLALLAAAAGLQVLAAIPARLPAYQLCLRPRGRLHLQLAPRPGGALVRASLGHASASMRAAPSPAPCWAALCRSVLAGHIL